MKVLLALSYVTLFATIVVELVSSAGNPPPGKPWFVLRHAGPRRRGGVVRSFFTTTESPEQIAMRSPVSSSGSHATVHGNPYARFIVAASGHKSRSPDETHGTSSSMTDAEQADTRPSPDYHHYQASRSSSVGSFDPPSPSTAAPAVGTAANLKPLKETNPEDDLERVIANLQGLGLNSKSSGSTYEISSQSIPSHLTQYLERDAAGLLWQDTADPAEPVERFVGAELEMPRTLPNALVLEVVDEPAFEEAYDSDPLTSAVSLCQLPDKKERRMLSMRLFLRVFSDTVQEPEETYALLEHLAEPSLCVELKNKKLMSRIHEAWEFLQLDPSRCEPEHFNMLILHTNAKLNSFSKPNIKVLLKWYTAKLFEYCRSNPRLSPRSKLAKAANKMGAGIRDRAASLREKFGGGEPSRRSFNLHQFDEYHYEAGIENLVKFKLEGMGNKEPTEELVKETADDLRQKVDELCETIVEELKPIKLFYFACGTNERIFSLMDTFESMWMANYELCSKISMYRASRKDEDETK